jgi:hypothetical protein
MYIQMPAKLEASASRRFVREMLHLCLAPPLRTKGRAQNGCSHRRSVDLAKITDSGEPRKGGPDGAKDNGWIRSVKILMIPTLCIARRFHSDVAQRPVLRVSRSETVALLLCIWSTRLSECRPQISNRRN